MPGRARRCRTRAASRWCWSACPRWWPQRRPASWTSPPSASARGRTAAARRAEFFWVVLRVKVGKNHVLLFHCTPAVLLPMHIAEMVVMQCLIECLMWCSIGTRPACMRLVCGLACARLCVVATVTSRLLYCLKECAWWQAGLVPDQRDRPDCRAQSLLGAPQVLVYHDLLGMMQHPHHAKVTPKFCKQYAAIGTNIQSALQQYRDEVRPKGVPALGGQVVTVNHGSHNLAAGPCLQLPVLSQRDFVGSLTCRSGTDWYRFWGLLRQRPPSRSRVRPVACVLGARSVRGGAPSSGADARHTTPNEGVPKSDLTTLFRSPRARSPARRSRRTASRTRRWPRWSARCTATACRPPRRPWPPRARRTTRPPTTGRSRSGAFRVCLGLAPW